MTVRMRVRAPVAIVGSLGFLVGLVKLLGF